MTNFGVRNAYGSLKTVLMHRPGPELALVTTNTLEEFHFAQPVQARRFISEYDGMLRLFETHGVDVLLLRDVLNDDADAVAYMDRRPNMTYTRDLAVVFSRGAVLMSPYLKGRWWDQQMMGRAFRRLGVPIIGTIEPPGYLEGGGVTMIGDDTAVVSLCDRATPEGTQSLRKMILGKDVKYFVEVTLPFGHIHIDGIFMVVDEKLALIYKEAFEAFPCRIFEAGRAEPRYVTFCEFLSERGIQLIPITFSERKGGHLNIVITQRSRKAVGFEKAVRVASELKKFGLQLDTFSADELFFGNGGAHCMTCPILIE